MIEARNNLERAVIWLNFLPKAAIAARTSLIPWLSAHASLNQFECFAIQSHSSSGNGRRQHGVADQNRRSAVYGPALRSKRLGFNSLLNVARDRTRRDSSVAETSPVSRSYAPSPETAGLKIAAEPRFDEQRWLLYA